MLIIVITYFIILGVLVFWRSKSLSTKIKKTFFPPIPTEETVQIQIEAMGTFLVNEKGTFKERKQVNRENYQETVKEHAGNRKRSCHEFLYPELTAYSFNRFELLDYYNDIILPSNRISNELKDEWRKTAIKSWVLIEK